MSDQNHAETIERLTLAAVPENQMIKMDDGRIFAFVAKGHGTYSLDNITPLNAQDVLTPKIVTQPVTLQDEGSLIVYTNRFKNSDTLLFADMTLNKIVAVIDYHQMPFANQPGDPAAKTVAVVANDKTINPTARLLAHTASLNLPFSEEWNLWKDMDGKMFGQLDFVRFIEENSPDITQPDAASLIEMCRDMQANRKVDFTSVVRTASNNAERFEFVDATKGNSKGGVELPNLFKLDIPVYFNGKSYELDARLRWHLDDNVLKLGIKLVRAEKLRQNVFKEIMGGIGEATDLDVLFGSTR